MARRLTPLRRVTTATRWPVGIALTSWNYLWRTTPMRRLEEPGAFPEDAPPPLPASLDPEDLQDASCGVGPLFHRRYRVRVTGASEGPGELMARVQNDVNATVPTELAVFHRMRGEPGTMRPGDEYLVRMPGPWDGPVRVVDVTPTSFRFVTLDGHLEAGQIEFRTFEDGGLAFEIESWARSGSRLSNLLYAHLRMSKEVQLHMWTSLLERVVRLPGGRRAGPIEIRTRRVDGSRGQLLLREERARRGLDALHARGLNFDADALAVPGQGWNVDDYRTALPAEPPGDPLADGSWEIARQLMRDYEFADPAIVRAVYSPSQPLEGRDMLLELRFHGLRFFCGVRVGEVRSATRVVEGRRVRTWGWGYRTLQGHLEMGQMDYEVWKWLDSGEVEFRIHVVSRAAPSGGPWWVRLGYRAFGRREQQRFARHAGERMARLTLAALERRPEAAAGVARAAEGIAVAGA